MKMSVYFITGMSGTGKSTIKSALAVHGYTTIDTDDHSHWVERKTGKSYPSRPDKTDWVGKYDWLLRDDELINSIQSHEGTMFVCGMVQEQEKLFPRFKKIFLLDAENETLRHRLSSRTNNPFGKGPNDIKIALDQKAKFNKRVLKEENSVLINASDSVEKVIENILKHVKD